MDKPNIVPVITDNVDVIIPVYGGYEQTKECIESVKSNIDKSIHKIIIINDCSPDEKISKYCRNQMVLPYVELIENESNLGFVASVNKGMKSSEYDVILLNSDTAVPRNWATKMSVCAYTDKAIATVTPFSNNATICSVDEIVYEKLSTVLSLDEIDNCFAVANTGAVVDIPTAVGFCMYIKRSAIVDIGLFDEEKFGKGYGEENDFSLRASSNGWKNVLCCDTFVYHVGGVSFSSESDERKVKAEGVMSAQHPEYSDYVQDHVMRDPAALFRSQALSVVAKTVLEKALLESPVIIHIIGTGGGGSYRYVHNLSISTNGRHFAILFSGSEVYLEDIASSLYYLVSSGETLVSLADYLSDDLLIDCFHLHCLEGQALNFYELIQKKSTTTAVTLHDVSFISPSIFSIDNWDTDVFERLEIDGDWKLRIKNICVSSDVVLVPSQYLKSLVLTEYEGRVMPLIISVDKVENQTPITLDEKERIHKLKLEAFEDDYPIVAVVGAVGKHKGYDFFKKLTDQRRCKINWLVIGYTEDDSSSAAYPESHYIVHGAYHPGQLKALIEAYKVDLIYFPPGIPESYCYALSDVLPFADKIAVHNRGALGERVARHRAEEYVLPNLASPDETLSLLKGLLKSNVLPDRQEGISVSEIRDLKAYETILSSRCTQEKTMNSSVFQKIQESMKYYDVDQSLYREELKRLSDERVFLNTTLASSKLEIDQLSNLASEREGWARNIETEKQQLKEWSDKQGSDIHELKDSVGELLQRIDELNGELESKGHYYAECTEELFAYQHSLKKNALNIGILIGQRIKGILCLKK